MRRINIFLILISIVAALAMSACDSENAGADADAAAAEAAENAPKDAYEDYIRSALASVDNGAQDVQTGDGTSPAPTGSANDGRAIQTDRTAPDDVYVSSMESPDTVDPFTDPSITPEEESPSPTEDPNATPTPTPTPYITPDEFDVGKCCIYVNGESDSAYGTEIVTAINKARTDLGYKAFVTNKGLNTCADRRTRETVAAFSHTRPNGLPFYSLAPEHFKAEMLILNKQKAEQAVDDIIRNDPYSKNLIFTEKYQSIGASSFKCNGLNYTVISFGL